MNDECLKALESWSRRFDGEPHASEEDPSHIENCRSCVEFVADAAKARETFVRLASTPLPAALTASITTLMVREIKKKRATETSQAGSALPRLWKLATVFACTLILVGFLATRYEKDASRMLRTVRINNARVSETGIQIDEDGLLELRTTGGSMLTIWTGPAMFETAGSGAETTELVMTSGTACFNWRSAASEKFTVKAGAAEVKVSGTSFRVKLQQDGEVEVSVSEGVVSVQGKAEPVRVEGFQMVRAGADGQVTQPASFNPMADPDFSDSTPISIRQR